MSQSHITVIQSAVGNRSIRQLHYFIDYLYRQQSLAKWPLCYTADGDLWARGTTSELDWTIEVDLNNHSFHMTSLTTISTVHLPWRSVLGLHCHFCWLGRSCKICPKARIFAPWEAAKHHNMVLTNYGKNAAIKAWEKLMYPNREKERTDSPKVKARGEEWAIWISSPSLHVTSHEEVLFMWSQSQLHLLLLLVSISVLEWSWVLRWLLGFENQIHSQH